MPDAMTFLLQLLADSNPTSFADTVDFSAWSHTELLQEEEQGIGAFGIFTIALVVLLAGCFFFMSWISSRYWERGIYPPFLRFRRINYYEAVINLSVNVIRCDLDNLSEKRSRLRQFVSIKFPDISGGITTSYRSAEKAPVSTQSISVWLKKHLHSDKEKTELLEFLFALAVTDGTLGKREHAILLAFAQHIGLDTAILNRLVETQRRDRAERLFDEQQRNRENRAPTYKATASEKARIVLGLPPGFTQEELKKAYRSLVKQFHPDKQVEVPEEEKLRMAERFIDVQEAYEQLTES
jgi:DnaJ like chaperone protein